MLSKTQTLKGITSEVIGKEKEHLHYIFWDLENCTLQEVIETLSEVQYEFKLGDIFIVSDCEKSFRAWCFSVRDWLTFLRILLQTKYVDYNFFYWTIHRGSATLRTSNKENRLPQEIVHILNGYETSEVPDKITAVTYDTGIDKRGKVINIG